MATASESKIKGFGIRFKLFFLFSVLIAAFAAQAYYLIVQLNNITDKFGQQGTLIIKELAENAIMATAQSVAKESQIYLEAHPELTKQAFMDNQRFKEIAIQKVGINGYTALYEHGDDGKWRTWVHTNPKITAHNLDDMAKLEKPLGASFAGFWKILTDVSGSHPSTGYYKWQEKDGTFKDKYMASVNVPGTEFYIASTTYIDEFTEPMTRLERESKATAKAESLRNAIQMAIIIAVIAMVVFIFGGRLAANIRYLSDMTDRISLGELDAAIEVRSKDELAVLAESISRLQQSVKLSIQRLRK
ncbi:MAG: HAMP domain-containing protein [Rhodocyclales bacterium]|nr:HAMP domain-containing protein [Rhodocyclales bacterium]